MEVILAFGKDPWSTIWGIFMKEALLRQGYRVLNRRAKPTKERFTIVPAKKGVMVSRGNLLNGVFVKQKSFSGKAGINASCDALVSSIGRAIKKL